MCAVAHPPSHAYHEPFYHVLPYLPLSLMLAERYLADGRPAWLAGLLFHVDEAAWQKRGR